MNNILEIKNFLSDEKEDKMIINRDYAHFTKEGLKFLMDQIYKNYNYIFN